MPAPPREAVLSFCIRALRFGQEQPNSGRLLQGRDKRLLVKRKYQADYIISIIFHRCTKAWGHRVEAGQLMARLDNSISNLFQVGPLKTSLDFFSGRPRWAQIRSWGAWAASFPKKTLTFCMPPGRFSALKLSKGCFASCKEGWERVCVWGGRRGA